MTDITIKTTNTETALHVFLNTEKAVNAFEKEGLSKFINESKCIDIHKDSENNLIGWIISHDLTAHKILQ